VNRDAGGSPGSSSGASKAQRVLVAPDKFKGCLTAVEVADALAAGLIDVRPDLEIVRVPVADGGDGTVAAALGAGFIRRAVESVGPTGRPVHTEYAVHRHRAVVELADVVGLDRLPGKVLDPGGSSTYGLGVLVGHAIDRGATEIVLGLGGSASTDGGAGMAQALGASLTDASGHELSRGGAALTDLDHLDLAALRARVRGVTFIVACDVDNPLLGPTGAAAVFGPQKGADATELAQLESGLTGWARKVAEATGADWAGHPGAGAAGGTGFAALALLAAELRPGIELVLDLVGFDGLLAGADLVITGEGSLDEQSLAGKAPVGVARAAARGPRRVPVVAVAGRTSLTTKRLREAGIDGVYPLAALEPDVAASIAHAPVLLRAVGSTIARQWLPAVVCAT
jgi:glycerate kinase